MKILIDTNILLDHIYLEGKEKPLERTQPSLDFLKYVKEKNKGKHLFYVQSNTLQELPKALSDKYVLQDLWEKDIPLIYYFSERRKRRIRFVEDIKDVIDGFHKTFLDPKLIIHAELSNFVKEDYRILVDLQIGCNLELEDSLLILGAIVGEINIFVTKDIDFTRNKKLKEFIKKTINPKLKILLPQNALKELK